MQVRSNAATKVHQHAAPPTAAAVRTFLTTPTGAGREGRPAVMTLGRMVMVNDELVNRHNVLGEHGLTVKNAPRWLEAIAGDRLKVHRAAAFDLPGGHKLWFVESETYKAGWYLDGAKSPLFVNEPGKFRAGKRNENIFGGG